MNTELVLNKSYRNAVFINYIEGTQLFLIRCIHDILISDGDYVDCVVVSINDYNEFNYDETQFFEQLKDAIKGKIDLYYFNNGGKFESSQQAYAFGKLYESGTKDLIYIHEDCFIQTSNTIMNLVENTKQNNKIFGGEVYKGPDYYSAKNHLFYFDAEKLEDYFTISDDKTWSGQTVSEEVKVDAGTGLLSYFFYYNKELLNKIDVNKFVIHRGNILESFHLNEDYYNIANDLHNFADCLIWFVNNQQSPNFLNSIFAKQFAYIASMVDNGIVIPEYDIGWLISPNVLKMNAVPYFTRKKA